MTALKEFARLETGGLWRSGPEAQRREVGVSFGKATLVLSDSNDRALAHWSLAAVHRVNPGNIPALFSPDGSASETLEIEDVDMINAIEKVQRSIDRARPRPGRLRWLLLTASFAVVGYLALWWLPGALVRHAVAVVPQVNRAVIGQDLLGSVLRLSGQPCAEPFGTVALGKLQSQVLPDLKGDVVVLRDGLADTRNLPGGTILMGRRVIEDFDDPAVAAGFLLAAGASAEAHDPLERMLNTTGTWSAVQLLTSGQIPPETLDIYARHLMTSPDTPANVDHLIASFETAQLPLRPYALALDMTGESTLDLIEADPFHGVSTKDVLRDGEWISLQSLCEED